MIEAFFCTYQYPWDEMRLDLALRQMDKWYVGDGLYSDGENFHWTIIQLWSFILFLTRYLKY
jgi:hypothetical protein